MNENGDRNKIKNKNKLKMETKISIKWATDKSKITIQIKWKQR